MTCEIFCSQCRNALQENETPCPHCGCTRRDHELRLADSIAPRDGMTWKECRPGFGFGRRKRPVAEGHVRDELSQKAALARNEQLIERGRRRSRWRFWERGRKFHRVTDVFTGEVIHEHDGPLDTWGRMIRRAVVSRLLRPPRGIFAKLARCRRRAARR